MPAFARLPSRLPARLRPVMLLCLCASLSAAAQVIDTSQPPPVLRYHFGDNPAWASPTFDDSAWPIAPTGQIPLPPFHSDGYVWVRARIPVRPDAESPLAVLLDGNENQLMADELYVNGMLVGQQGALTPRPVIDRAAEPAVFGIPLGAVTPGASALVAFRAWSIPGARVVGSGPRLRFTIDSSRFTRLARSARHQRTLIALGPQLGANLLITCFGLGLLLLWRRSGGRDILLCAVLLLLYAPVGILSDLQLNGVLHIPLTVYALLYSLILILQMDCLIEFIWTIHAFRNRFWKRLAQAALLVFNGTVTICLLDYHPSALVAWSVPACIVSVYVFDAIAFGANLWALVVQRRNQLIAAALAFIPLAASLARLDVVDHFSLGPFSFNDFNFAFLLSALALFIMLGKRAWTAWGEANNLRAEFDAAREVQERLVIPPPAIPGFRMERAYIPATQVGGDFYHIRPDDKGGVQIVVGDVSGKGLRAAMAVSAIVGALRAMPLLPPSRILFDLNRGLNGNLGGGFVTCSVTQIEPDGKMIIANAGHLSPYRNGVELSCGDGLPLGIALDMHYEERRFDLAPGDTLTFLSDGVVEARNHRGELYGFDRTQKISGKSAAEIAHAAQAFGQEDDITVLTLAFDKMSS
jgi:phosphoserine phosphatase RsbU/P